MEEFYFYVSCVMFAVVGLCIGSFLNVVVYRLPRGMNLAKPASHCPDCGHALAWYDNIPLLSFLMLKGKCRYCGAGISPRYFFVELCNAVLWLLCVLAFYERGLAYVSVCAVAASLVVTMSLCDMENLFIPDSLQIAFALVALVGIFVDPSTFWKEKIYGCFLGGGFFLFFYVLSFPLFGREGLGFGDVKLMAGAGLLLGWKSVCVSVLFGVLYALFDILPRKLKKHPNPFGNEEEYPFAPYLAAGILFAMFFGEAVVRRYVGLLF